MAKTFLMKNNYSHYTLLNERQGNYWVKIIETEWDAEEYKKYYNYFGNEFLPKLIDYETDGQTLKLTMEYIEGVSLKSSQYNSTFRYVSYKIIPTLYEWTRLRPKGDLLYMHCDLKFDNFLISENNKLYLMDIDAFCWISPEFFETMLTQIYKNDFLYFEKNS
jgi:serine/threonine protein kinase